MRRRSGAGDKPVQTRRRKAMTLKRGIAPKTVRRRSSADAIQETEIARVIRERDEALEQRTAISDILRVISNSPSDVQPVLNSVAEHAARICEAHIVDIAIVDNEVLRTAASFGELGRPKSLPLDRSSVTGRSICDLQPVHIADMENASDEFPLGREFATRFGHRTILSVPLIREGRALGAILVRRTEVRPFEQKHISLLTTFADQAAIAIENVRLFEAEQQRTRELPNRSNNRRLRRKCCRSLAALPAMSSPCLRLCWRKPYGSATPSLAPSAAGTATPLASWRRIMYRPPTPRHTGFHRFVPVRSTIGVAWLRPKRRFRSPMLQLTRATLNDARKWWPPSN